MSKRRPVPRWVVSLLFSAGVSLICCSGILFKVWTQLKEPADQLQTELKAARAEGIPLSASDLPPQPELSVTDNAGTDYLQAGKAFAALGQEPPLTSIDAVIAGTATDSQVAQARTDIDSFKDVMTWVEKGATKAKCVISVAPSEERPTWLGALNHSLHTLGAEVALAPTIIEAKRLASIAEAIASHLMSQRSSDAIMVGVNAKALLCRASFAFAKRNPGVVDAETIADQFPDAPGVRQVIAVQVVEEMRLFDLAADCKGPLAKKSFEAPCKTNTDEVKVYVSGLESRFIKGLRSGWNALPLDGDLKKSEDALLIPLRAANDEDTMAGAVYAQWMQMQDVWSAFIERIHELKRVQAWNQLVQAGFYALDQFAQTGAYPKSLPDPLSADPYGGRLTYEPSKTGFVLYSVGPSGKGLDAPDDDLYLLQVP